MSRKATRRGTALVRRLESEVARLRRQLRALQRRAAEVPGAPRVSPLAPKGGFPVMPPIAGVSVAVAEAGVRYRGRPDVMLAKLAPGTVVAGVFTRSATRSAAVLDCERKIAAGSAGAEPGAAIVVNSGNANAFTGAAGEAAVDGVAQATAHALALPPERVFTASTGVIGEPLAHERITAVLPELAGVLSPAAMEGAARAIMTTDTFAKGATTQVSIGGQSVRIAGIAKGSGMIAPDMATMLAYVFTDAAVSAPVLQDMLHRVTDRTFNRITVDGDTSTSDTVMVAATGQSAAPRIESDSEAAAAFEAGLETVMRDLALQVVRDGEGATKLVEVRVSGAESPEDAGRVASAVANSPLVKTAVAGEDPNWGRIVMAVGKSGARAERDRLAISLGGIRVTENGQVADTYREADGAAYMRRDEIVIGVDLGLGDASATMWTCDLTHAYIDINADYRS